MAVSTITSGPTEATRKRYKADYVKSAFYAKLYDMFAVPAMAALKAMSESTSVQLNFLADMQINEHVISDTTDLVPQQLHDASVTITPTTRMDGIMDTEELLNAAYTDYGKRRHEVLGRNLERTIDHLAMKAMINGSLVHRAAARASLDAGTASHRISDTSLSVVEALFSSRFVPAFVTKDAKVAMPPWVAMMGPELFHDVRSGGNIVDVAKYQDKRILLNKELGQFGSFRFVVTPYAKKFGAAGLDNASAVATTLTSAAKALDKVVNVAADTNIAVGQKITIGTEETGTTLYPMNEEVTVVSISTLAITIAGGGVNGGLQFGHASGEGFRNADNVYTAAYGGPASIAKVFDQKVGEYGKIMGPKIYGIAEQWVTLTWKWKGNYDRVSESWLMRGEYPSSLDA